MAKVRVFSLAKEMGLQTEALLAALSKLGVENVTKASAIDEETANTVREIINEQAVKAKAQEEERVEEEAAAKAAAAATKPVAVVEPPVEEKKAPEKAPEPTPTPAERAAKDKEERERKEREGRLPGGPPRL
ncbi:MAG: translation initiation factor IF-2 N-terminal domain-containing protein, partial [Armatimonadia bacterium]